MGYRNPNCGKEIVLMVMAFAATAPGTCNAAQANQSACKARQMELYREGGGAAAGSQEQTVAMRNISDQPCTLTGTPILEFFDEDGERLAIPYGKNEASMMFQKQPEKIVTLMPGAFAHFKIGTTTGNEDFHFYSMRALLPGDKRPLAVDAQGDHALASIDVSAIVSGIDSEDDWLLPTQSIARLSESVPGLSLTLTVPSKPRGPFDAHFTLLNTGAAPVLIDSKQCSLSGRLTNSAGKVVWENEECGVWAGDIDEGGLLRPGARASADIAVGDVALQLCREGRWNGQFALNIAAGTVVFAELPFEVVSTGCSDSEHVGDYVDEKSIRWSLIPQHGVRLGVQVRAKGDIAPAMAPISDSNRGPLAPEFHAGEPIELRLYLDDLADAPLQWRNGPAAFRVAVRIWGHGDMLTPSRTMADGEGDTQVTVLPHTWQYVRSVRLNDFYKLSPGSYEILVGPRTLMGSSAAANAPATGWPAVAGAATAVASVKVVPSNSAGGRSYIHSTPHTARGARQTATSIAPAN